MKDPIERQDAINAINRCMDIYINNLQTMIYKADAYKALTDLPSAQRWIPIKTRPMDKEERECWEDQFGGKLEEEDAVIFDCPMPEDGQEILVSYKKWIHMDKCEICYGGLYGLEGNGDWEDVLAWMPLPEPWRGEEDEQAY